MFHHLSCSIRQAVLLIAMLVACGIDAAASEFHAVEIARNIRQFHMPYGTVLDPVFASSDRASPDYSKIVSYAKAGDSAIWTGHFLAAEAFRYRATGSAEALDGVWHALYGIHSLLDVTGTDLLARCLVPVDSPYAGDILNEEGRHGIHYSEYGYYWIGNTSRDQYSGVMFGLSTAYEMVNDANVRNFIRSDVRRIVNYLLRRGWSVVMPDGSISTSFAHRPDQMLSFLQVARRIDPQTFNSTYSAYRFAYASTVMVPIAYDNIDDHNHYFKFNLNYINLYNLARLEDDSSLFKRAYMDAYNSLRRRTESHRNPHFNMIDRALKGANSTRDAETASLLQLWLERSRRDYWSDLRGVFPACGDDRACSSIPVNYRVNTDFLWQRSPFLLYGGGYGVVETSGIDYILPYWMARSLGLPL